MTFRVFLDMDGVLADFCSAAFKLHGRENPYHSAHNLGEWDCIAMLGMTPEDFYAPMEHEFWANMDKTELADDLVLAVQGFVGVDNICLLTTPHKNPGSISGKKEWIHKHFPQFDHRVLFGSPKHFCAHEDSLLIDDNEENVEIFSDHGGHTLLVPRPWNYKSSIKNPMTYIRGWLDAFAQ